MARANGVSYVIDYPQPAGSIQCALKTPSGGRDAMLHHIGQLLRASVPLFPPLCLSLERRYNHSASSCLCTGGTCRDTDGTMELLVSKQVDRPWIGAHLPLPNS